MLFSILDTVFYDLEFIGMFVLVDWLVCCELRHVYRNKYSLLKVENMVGNCTSYLQSWFTGSFVGGDTSYSFLLKAF